MNKKILLIIFVLFLISLASFVSAHSYTPITYHKFEDLLDSESNNYNLKGTYTNFVAGKIDNAIDMTPNEYVYNHTVSGAIIGTARTIDLWVNFDTANGGDRVMSIGKGVADADAFDMWFGAGQADFRAVLCIDSANKFTLNYASIAFSTWYHIVVTMNASNGAVLYVNNVVQDTDVSNDVFPNDWTGMRFSINDELQADKGMDGLIDNVALFAETYTVADVAYSYNGGNGIDFGGGGGGATDTINISSPHPADSSQFNISTINFNATVNASYVFNCSLYINEILNETKTGFTAGNNVFVNFTKTFSDGDYNYSFFCKDNSTNETTSTNLFYIDTVVPSISYSSLEGDNTYWTNEQDLIINITETNPYSIMINDSCGYGYYNNSISSPYQFNEGVNISGCGVGEQQTNVTICDGHGDTLNCVSDSYIWYSRARLNITAYAVGGSSISNFSIYADGVLEGSTTEGYYHLDNLTFNSYNITIDIVGYELKSDTVVINLTYQEFNLSFYTTNSINFTFKDEETKDIINNVEIELISSVYANNYSTSTGWLYVDLLSPSTYTMRYVATNYTERFYYFNLQNRSHTDLTLYLLKNQSVTEVTAYVYDEGNHPIEDAYIKVLRYDIITNAYVIQEIRRTNFEGKTQLNLVLNDEFYKFIIEYPLGTIKKETSPTYIYATTLNFQILLGEEVASNFYNSQDVSYSLVFNNDTNNFRFTYSDANNIVSMGCLEVYKITSFRESFYNSSCASSATSTILVNVANMTGVTYRADAFIYFGSEEYYLTSEYHSFEEDNITGNLGVLMIIILTILFIFIGYWSKPVALILTPLPLFFGSMLNIIDLSIAVTLPIEIICVVVAIWVSRR